MKKILLFAACLAASPALAIIGETGAQCEARYGAVLKYVENQSLYVFQKGNVRSGCKFLNGYCSLVSVNHIQSGNVTIPMSQEQIDSLLLANGGGREWVRWAPERPELHWRTTDGALVAIYSPTTQALLVATQEQMALEKAARVGQ